MSSQNQAGHLNTENHIAALIFKQTATGETCFKKINATICPNSGSAHPPMGLYYVVGLNFFHPDFVWSSVVVLGHRVLIWQILKYMLKIKVCE